MVTRNLSGHPACSRFLAVAVCFLLLPILHPAAQTIDLGTVTTILRGANLERHFSQEDIASSTASSLVDFLGQNNCLVMSTGGAGSQTTLSIRGYAGACIKVYVDGVLANNPNTGEFDWNSLPLEAIDAITIHDTPILGQEEFAGTTISISTKSFSARKISMGLSSQSYETNAFDTNQFAFRLQDVVAGTAFKASLGGTTAANRYGLRDGGTKEANGYQSASGILGWNRFVGDHLIGGTHNLSYNRIQVPAGRSVAGVQSNLFTAHTVFGELHDAVGLTKVLFNYKLDSLSYGEEGEGGQNTRNKFHDLTLQLDYSIPFRQWDYGKPDVQNWVNQSQLGFSLKGGAILSHFSSASSSVGKSPSRYSLYPSLTFVLGHEGWLQIQPMAGYLLTWDSMEDSDGRKTILHHNFNGALTLTWAYWSLSFSTQSTLPTFNQLYWNYAGLTLAQENAASGIISDGKLAEHGNPDLKPESGYSLRLKMATDIRDTILPSFRYLTLIPFSASLGFSYYQNKIRWVSSRYGKLPYATLHTENSGAAYYFDATVHSRQSYRLGSHWRLGYQLQVAVTKTFLLDREYYGNQIMWVPLVLLNSALEAGYKRLALTVGYDFTSRRYTSNYNTTYYAPIHLVRCSLSYQYSESLSLILEGNNLLDQHYLYHDGYWAPSRSYTVKIKAAF